MEPEDECEELDAELVECELTTLEGELVEQFNELDADHDGQISREEWLASGEASQCTAYCSLLTAHCTPLTAHCT